jgi:Tfp pilus assembly protein PilF
MSMLLYRKGDSKGALAELDAVIAATPDAEGAYYQKGQIYEGMGNADDARKNYEKAVQLSPSYTDAILALKRLESKATH